MTIYERIAREIATNCPEIDSIYLGGSYASGNNNKFSDLDLYLFASEFNESLNTKLLNLNLSFQQKNGVRLDISKCHEEFLTSPMPFGHKNFSVKRNLLYSSKHLLGKRFDLKPFSHTEVSTQLIEMTLEYFRLSHRQIRGKNYNYTYIKRLVRYHLCLITLQNESLWSDPLGYINQGPVNRKFNHWRSYASQELLNITELIWERFPIDYAFTPKFFIMFKREIEDFVDFHQRFLKETQEDLFKRLEALAEDAPVLETSDLVMATFRPLMDIAPYTVRKNNKWYFRDKNYFLNYMRLIWEEKDL